MNKFPRDFARRVYVEKDFRAVVVERILCELRALGLPVVEPHHIGPLAGLTAAQFRQVCRSVGCIGFEFRLDDAESLRVLRGALTVALGQSRRTH